MRFRLTYEGPLLSSQPTHKTNQDDGTEADKRAEHKHFIRRKFHTQMKAFWAASRLMRDRDIFPWSAATGGLLPEAALSLWPNDPNAYRLSDVLARIYTRGNYRYVPLVWKEASLTCSLRFLCIRQDHNSALTIARDLDNRIKTVIDALCIPPPKQGSPIKDGVALPPQDGEDPFFCLLDDDRQVTTLKSRRTMIFGRGRKARQRALCGS